MKEKIVLGLSGGVDSAVAARLLQERYDVTGLYLDIGLGGTGAADAAAVAERLGIPFETADIRAELEREVCAPFAADYRAGRTPLPCARCNPAVKFPALFALAGRIGARYVSTGHYARVENGGLKKGMPANDQSYMLARLTREQLQRVIFPLGDYEKAQVRALARGFGIPVAEHIDPEKKYPQAVIMAPTRELAQQIAEELTELTYFMPEVQVACVYGGANMEKQARRLAEGCQIVVATPGRLMDHYKHHSIDLAHVTQVVLDEADEMLNMGFYKDVRHIIELMKARKSLSMFSATISREVMDIGWLYQNNAEEITVQPREESQPKITQYMLETSGRNKLSDLAQIIIGEGYKRVMVFCDTKFNTATLANQLARLGFSVDCLHGDLSQKERNQIMQNFRDGRLAILVATDVAARGIDVSDVDAVINYDVPGDNEHYTHRIGRTGRAKKEGVSYLFYVPEEKKRVQELLRLTRNTDLCTPVHFDFNHERIVVEKKQDNADRFQIKCYF